MYSYIRMYSLYACDCHSCWSWQSGIWLNSPASRSGSRSWPEPIHGFGSCRYKPSGTCWSNPQNTRRSHTALKPPCGSGSCPHKPSCRPCCRAPDNIPHSRTLPQTRLSGRCTAYICRRSCPRSANAATYSWRYCRHIRSCRRRTDTCRRRKRLVRLPLKNKS